MNLRDKAFFQPLWRRILVLVICLAWTALEWLGGLGFWSALASLVTVYAIWTLFIRFDPELDEQSD